MSARINSNNYINIQSFMVTDLKLKGNRLLIYAIIYGFSQTTGQECTASLNYFAEWTNSTVRGVEKAMNSLVRDGLITKTMSVGQGNKYIALTPEQGSMEQNAIEQNAIEQSSMEQSSSDSRTKFDAPSNKVQAPLNKVHNTPEHSSPNNINNNIKNKINNNIEIYSARENFENENEKNLEKPKAYGEYENVNLSDKELGMLKSEFPSDWEERIERVSEYCAKTGKAYHNYLAVIRSWAKRDLNRENERKREYDAGRGGVNTRKSGFNNYVDAEETDYAALDEKLMEMQWQ